MTIITLEIDDSKPVLTAKTLPRTFAQIRIAGRPLRRLTTSPRIIIIKNTVIQSLRRKTDIIFLLSDRKKFHDSGVLVFLW